MGPNSWQSAGQNALGGGMGGGFNWQGIGNGLGSVLGGLFGPDQGAPYQAAMNQYQQYANQANAGQQPFFNAGVGAIPQYQNWLAGQQDPSKFINGLMGNYQESPQAKYLTDQAMKAGTNAASASGLTGSTPFAQQMAQTAGGISSQDLNNWLSQVLGINSQYGQGLGNQVGWGQNAANQMSNTYNQEGNNMAQAAYGQQQAQNNQQSQVWGGLGSLLGSGIGALGGLF
jgi:hypothetical protein